MIKLDEKDKILLDLLFEDGRISNTQLAKKAGISKEVVAYRLKRLEKEGLLKKIIPIIDFSKLNYELYRIQLKFKSIKKEEYEKIIDDLKTYPHVSWIIELQGNWNLAILFFVQSNHEFEDLYNTILKKYHSLISDKQFTIVTQIKHLTPTYITERKKHFLITGKSKSVIELDDTAKKILELLLKNGRGSLIEIANKLNFTINTIKYHIKKLENSNIIVGYRPVLDISKLGYERFKIFLNLEDIENRKEITNILLTTPNVVYIFQSLSKYDIEFEIEYQKMQELLNFISKLKEKFTIREHEIIYGNNELLINEVPY